VSGEQYIELHARSAFSFLRGAATPEELIAVCSKLKMTAMALLDNDGVYGAARFHLAGKKLKVKAHIGAEIAVSSFESADENQKSPQISGSKTRNSKLETRNSELGTQHSLSHSWFAIAPVIKTFAGWSP